jgi:hypothetical protein
MDSDGIRKSASIIYNVLVSQLPYARLARIVAEHESVRVIFFGRYDVVIDGAATPRHEVIANEIGISLLDPLVESL